jgi:hypothetical protein
MAQPAAATGGTDRFADGQTQLLQLVKIRPGIIDRALLSAVGGRTRKFQRDFNHVRVLSPTVGRLGWVGGRRRAGQRSQQPQAITRSYRLLSPQTSATSGATCCQARWAKRSRPRSLAGSLASVG